MKSFIIFSLRKILLNDTKFYSAKYYYIDKKFYSGNLKERGHLGNLDTDGRILLKLI
jgi:hypothetical protein